MPILCQKAVVSSASAERESQPGCVSLKNHPRIIVEIPNDTQIKTDIVRESVGFQNSIDLFQIVNGRVTLLTAREVIKFLQEILFPVQKRKLLDRQLILFREGQCINDSIHEHNIMTFDCRLQCLSLHILNLKIGQDSIEEGNLPHVDLKVLDSGLQNCFDCKRDNFCIRSRAVTPHQFDSCLMKFTLSPRLGLFHTEHIANIG